MAMIKCPECGHDVSSNAAFCPNCGIKIANNIKFCSACGAPMIKSASQCPECGKSYVDEAVEAQSAPTATQATTVSPRVTPTTNMEANQDAATNMEPEAPKKKANPWLITLIIVAVLAIGGGIGYFAMHSSSTDSQEEADYEILKGGDTNIQDYQDFLAKYPDSKYKSDVQEMMNTAKAWNNIVNSSSKEDFSEFMNKYPSSAFEGSCKTKIDSLDWLQAKQLNTPEAIQNYMNQHPDGKYFSDAQIAQSTLNEQATQQENSQIQPNEDESARTTMSTFFSGLGNNDKTEICASLAPTMNYFLKKQNATKADVINWMVKLHSGDITSTTYNVNDIALKKTPSADGTAAYDVTCSVDNNIQRTCDGETFASYTVTAKLNSQFKIIVMKMRKVSSR